MKPNRTYLLQPPEKHVSIESHLARGRQLHSAAIFNLCAIVLKRIQLPRSIREKQTKQPQPCLGQS